METRLAPEIHVRIRPFGLRSALLGALLLTRLGAEPATKKTFENSLGMAFRLIPAGSYRVGPANLEPEKAPWVTGSPSAGTAARIPKPFYLCAHEVRVRDYRAFMEATERGEPEGELYIPKSYQWKAGFKPLSDETWGKADLPVTCVTYEDAVAFCEWLSRKEGRTYRLPTEVEWEYAARAGSSKPFQWEDQLYPTKINGALANDCPIRANPGDEHADAEAGLEAAEDEDKGDAATAAGGETPSPDQAYPPNAWGLYHALGNVQEFVALSQQPTESDMPFPGWTMLPGKVNRMLRGGSWVHSARDCTVYQANYNCPPYSNCTIGFRVLLEAGEVGSEK
jgi:formylglycine-generating enzyme required for sulfatase activity